jgi:hypothetical protein
LIKSSWSLYTRGNGKTSIPPTGAGSNILYDWIIIPNPEAELSLQLLVVDVNDSWSGQKQLPDNHADLNLEIVESRERSSCDPGIAMGGFGLATRVCRYDDQQSEGLLVERK